MIDYFEFYGLPISFNPDTVIVKQKFYEFSKKYHPDFFINELEEKQAEVLEKSTVNNKAYQILSDPQKRLPYILELKGQLSEGEHYKLPQDFLMDMMDINETLLDLQFDPDAEKLSAVKVDVSAVDEGIQKEIDFLTDSFESKSEAEQAILLPAVKDLYYRSKYLSRIKESMDKASAS
ncbi:Fe-S protein assembly co-chaperone HscB [Pedobacter sp. JCM 36344]|uniref:Fe-S protein assembly co-chaperone HscB n=1 Tax=Pedobacter sp. JCM 36344 TaxID=3374280 RepID=UPI00397D3BE2